MHVEGLIERFQEAGLQLVRARQPIARGRGSTDVFQFDIRRRKASDPHSEYFLFWPGHEDNIAQVLGLDKRLRQLVLMVKEPPRDFDTEILKWQVQGAKKTHGERWRAELKKQAESQRARLVEVGGKLYVRRRTPDAKRHFLVGQDERQLFMCQLSRAVTTVKDAHASLRAPTLQMYEGRADGRTIRQGEWFFVNLNQAEREELEKAIKTGKALVRSKVNIGTVIPRAGKPHTADELAVVRLNASGVGRDSSAGVRDLATGDTFAAGVNVFVRGAVRHADHKTIKFSQWRRVIRNNEQGGSAPSLGGTWID